LISLVEVHIILMCLLVKPYVREEAQQATLDVFRVSMNPEADARLHFN
jgi:hypothetical protein